MKYHLPLLLAAFSLIGVSCRVSDPDKEQSDKDGKGVGTNVTDPTANMLGLLLTSDQQEIYKLESISLSWSSKQGSKCSLRANDKEIGKDLDSSGALKASPEADTTYLLTCTNGDITNSTSMNISPLSETLVELPLLDKDEVASYLDITKLSEDCQDGKICYFTDLEKELFKKNSQGWVETQAFTKILSSNQSAFPAPKILALDSLAASFDVDSSIVYGFQGDLQQLKLDDVCKANIPFAVGTSIPADLILSQTLSNGFEEISNGLLNVSVFSDLKIEGYEKRSVVQKGSSLSASYFNTEIRGKISGSYLDYGMASGKFIGKGKTNRSIAKMGRDVEIASFGEVETFDFQRASYSSVPDGYRLPAKGYGGDANAFIPTDPFCSVSRQRVDSGFMGSIQTWYGPVSDYFPRYSSKRIVKGPATIQCNGLFDYDAKQYGLGSEWKITMDDALWFVTDGNWPSCDGYECLGKDLIVSYAATFPLQEWEAIEPSYNYCIDRWAGISIEPYISSIKSTCYGADVYKAAIAQHQATENDIAFYRKCSNLKACDDFVTDVGMLSTDFPPSKLRLVLSSLKARTEAAKASGQSFLITDKMFSKRELSAAVNRVQKIRENYSVYETLRTSISASVNGFARYDFPSPLEPEFKTSEGIMKMMDEYDGLLKEAQSLGNPLAEVVGCTFAANGKFRSYEGISVSDLKIVPLSKNTKIVTSLRDFRVD